MRRCDDVTTQKQMPGKPSNCS